MDNYWKYLVWLTFSFQWIPANYQTVLFNCPPPYKHVWIQRPAVKSAAMQTEECCWNSRAWKWRRGVIFTNSPRREGEREVVRGKLQTNTVRFVCFFFPPNPWKKQSLSSFRYSNNICKQLRAYKKGEGAQNTMQLTPLPIKTELNKSSSSNHSHMNTCVAVIQPAKDIFVPLVQIPSYITSACV